MTIKRSLYSLAGQVIATRVVSTPAQSSDGLFYFLSDHLGSTRLLTTIGGTVAPGTTAHFLPYGSYRGGAPTSEITDKGFTGHKHVDPLGLVYMNARFYLPGSGRFLSADTIVPNPANPQDINRYSYVLGNPISFKDPSGHCRKGYMGDDYEDYECLRIAQQVAHKYKYSFNKLAKYDWTLAPPGTYDPDTHPAIEVGGKDIGATLVVLNGQKAEVNGHDVYDIHVETWNGRCACHTEGKALIEADPSNSELVAFMGQAGIYADETQDMWIHGTMVLGGLITGMVGFVTTVEGASAVAAAPAAGPLAPAVATAGTAQTTLGLAEMTIGTALFFVGVAEFSLDAQGQVSALRTGSNYFDNLAQSNYALAVSIEIR